MGKDVTITQEPGQDGVTIRVGVYEFTISGTEWATRKANQDFQLSSLEVNHTLTAEEIAEINRLL
jgi:hypothetical protein